MPRRDLGLCKPHLESGEHAYVTPAGEQAGLSRGTHNLFTGPRERTIAWSCSMQGDEMQNRLRLAQQSLQVIRLPSSESESGAAGGLGSASQLSRSAAAFMAAGLAARRAVCNLSMHVFDMWDDILIAPCGHGMKAAFVQDFVARGINVGQWGQVLKEAAAASADPASAAAASATAPSRLAIPCPQCHALSVYTLVRPSDEKLREQRQKNILPDDALAGAGGIRAHTMSTQKAAAEAQKAAAETLALTRRELCATAADTRLGLSKAQQDSEEPRSESAAACELQPELPPEQPQQEAGSLSSVAGDMADNLTAATVVDGIPVRTGRRRAPAGSGESLEESVLRASSGEGLFGARVRRELQEGVRAMVRTNVGVQRYAAALCGKVHFRVVGRTLSGQETVCRVLFSTDAGRPWNAATAGQPGHPCNVDEISVFERSTVSDYLLELIEGCATIDDLMRLRPSELAHIVSCVGTCLSCGLLRCLY